MIRISIENDGKPLFRWPTASQLFIGLLLTPFAIIILVYLKIGIMLLLS